MMNEKDTIFAITKDEAGNEYFCPHTAATDNRSSAPPLHEECVEASIVGRYAGNLNLRGKPFSK